VVAPSPDVLYLHRDQLNSVHTMSVGTPGDADEGEWQTINTYRPFGSVEEHVNTATTAPDPTESKGFIGERFDEDAGLQYLNARYYDPELGMFIQPDWFEVTKAGVGTNRYAYAGNDPVNLGDPGGNFFADPDADQDLDTGPGKGIAGWFTGSDTKDSGYGESEFDFDVDYDNSDLIDGTFGNDEQDLNGKSYSRSRTDASLNIAFLENAKAHPFITVAVAALAIVPATRAVPNKGKAALANLFYKEGKAIGIVYPGAKASIRTVPANELVSIVETILKNGTKTINTTKSGTRSWYSFPGSAGRVSLRESDKYGPTLDVDIRAIKEFVSKVHMNGN
jgi:RHS repeat-associated protein